MMKIVETDDDEVNSARILNTYNGQGSVRLYQDDENAFLLEYAIAGKNAPAPLDQMVVSGTTDKATHILCDTIDLLHNAAAQKPIPEATPLSKRFSDMQCHMNEGRIPKEKYALCQRALDISQDLYSSMQNKDNHILLHGDIHHFNVLYDQNRGWLAIDPKGFIGPKAYEYAAIFCNPYRHSDIVCTKDYMRRLAAIIAERSQIEKTEILTHAFIHSAQVCAWSLSPHDQEYWYQCAALLNNVLNEKPQRPAKRVLQKK